jgi:hypothetical protein
MSEDLIQERPKMSSAPNWTSIFTLHPELDPPGYAEVFISIKDNPYISPKQLKKDEAIAKKKKKKLGRGETAN